MVAGDLGEDAVPLQQRHDHHLREQPLAGRLQHRPTAAQPQRLGPAELDADHQPPPAHLVQQLVLVDERRQPLAQQLAGAPGVPATSCSSSSTESVASPAAIACALEPKLAEWTSTRSIDE